MRSDEKQRAIKRAQARPAHPGAKLEQDNGDWLVTAPDGDVQSWELVLADTFGTRSISAMRIFVRDLKALCRDEYDCGSDTQWKPSETELNAALAMVADVKPRNTAEAALAAQMVAIHWLQMRLSRDALNNGGMVLDKEASLASKLARTFAMQLETLRALRGGKRALHQKFTVNKTLKQEVVYVDRRGAGDAESGGQPRGRTVPGNSRIADESPLVRGADPGGRIVSLPCPKRQG